MVEYFFTEKISQGIRMSSFPGFAKRPSVSFSKAITFYRVCLPGKMWPSHCFLSGSWRGRGGADTVENADPIEIGEESGSSSGTDVRREQQRVAIARALINDPEIVIADEPTSNIDAESIKILLDIFMDLKSKGKTIIVSSHDPVFLDCSETIFFLKDGRLVNIEQRESK